MYIVLNFRHKRVSTSFKKARIQNKIGVWKKLSGEKKIKLIVIKKSEVQLAFTLNRGFPSPNQSLFFTVAI